MITTIYQMFLAFSLAVLAIWLLRRPAIIFDLIDHPGGRKEHARPVPLIGGIGIFIAFSMTLLIFHPIGNYVGLIAGMGLLLFIGVVDDLRDLNARSRLLVQVFAGFILTALGDMSISNLGNLLGFGEIVLGPWDIAFTVFCVVGLINAVNMFDGMDGLAGGYVFVAACWLAYAAFISGSGSMLLIIVLAAAVAGFLMFNLRHAFRNRASVFMGDAGSMLLGFVLAWFGTDLASGNSPYVPPVVLVWILGLPVMDTLSLMIRRIRKGGSPFSADREHLHHIFQRAGFSYNVIVLILTTMSLLMGAIGMIGWQLGLPESVLFLGFIILFVIHAYFVTHAWRAMRIIKMWKRD